MGSFIDKIKIRSLKGQLEEARHRCDALALQFETAATSAEKSAIARRYDQALKHTHALQLMVELMERRQRESQTAEK